MTPEQEQAQARLRREGFAKAALMGLLASENVDSLKTPANVIAVRAWYLASAMLEQEPK